MPNSPLYHRRLLGLALLGPACAYAGVVLDKWAETPDWDPVRSLEPKLQLAVAVVSLLGSLLLWFGPRAPTLDRWFTRRRLGRLALLSLALTLLLLLIGHARDPGQSWSRPSAYPAIVALILATGLANPLGRRRTWIACLGAGVTLGILLRLSLFWSHPLPVIHYDTRSYIGGAHSLLAGGDFTLNLTRTPAFPLLYAGSVWAFGLIGAHVLSAGLGVVTALAVAASLRGASRVAALLVGLLVFVNPEQIGREHSLTAETTLGAFLILQAVFTLTAIARRDEQPKRWLCLAGLAAGLAVLTKPVALASLAAGGLAIVWTCRRPLRRRLTGTLCYASSASALLLAWAVRNKIVHGFFGLTLFGGQSLFGVAGHLVVLDSPPHAEIKALIRPQIEEFREHHDLNEINWLMYSSDGPFVHLLHLDEVERDHVAKDLAVEGIKAAPGRFAYAVWYRGRPFLRPRHRPWRPRAPDDPVHRREERLWGELCERELTPKLLEDARTPRLTPDLRYRAWARSFTAFRMVNGVLYPIYMLIHLLALGAVLLVRDPRVVIPALLGWSILLLTAIGNVPLTRYVSPLQPLFLLACGWAWVLWCRKRRAAADTTAP